MIYVGMDWARREHHYVVLCEEGKVLAEGRVAHSAPALNEFKAMVAELEPCAEQVYVSMEMHTGGLLAWLRTQPYELFVLPAKSADRARDIFRPSGGKDDRADALTLARLVHMGADCLRKFEPPCERSHAQLQLLEEREKLVQARVAKMHQIGAILAEYSPELSVACNDLNRIWQRQLLSAYPSQQALTQAQWEDIRAICSRCRPNTIALVRAAFETEAIPLSDTELTLAEAEVRWLLESFETITQRIEDIEAELESSIADHPRLHLVESLPIKGLLTKATLLAMMEEAGETDWEDLAPQWGVAPVTKQSGEYEEVRRRRACNHHICRFLTQFAFNTTNVEGSWAQADYQRKRGKKPEGKRRKRDKKHYTTLRCIAKTWVKILHAMWRDNAEYDEQYHQANRRAAA